MKATKASSETVIHLRLPTALVEAMREKARSDAAFTRYPVTLTDVAKRLIADGMAWPSKR